MGMMVHRHAIKVEEEQAKKSAPSPTKEDSKKTKTKK